MFQVFFERTARKRLLALPLSISVMAAVVSGCSTSVSTTKETQQSTTTLPSEYLYPEARVENQAHRVATTFEKTPQVIADTDGSGVETSRRFFDKSDTVVVSSTEISAKLRAASIAVVSHAPMLTMTDQNRMAVLAEITRLGASYVLVVGDVALAAATGTDAQTVIQDTGTFEALGRLTSLQFHQRSVPAKNPQEVNAAVAALDAADVTYLVPEDAQVSAEKSTATSTNQHSKNKKEEQLHPFPVQSDRDAKLAPVVIASQYTSVASIATANSYGATVKMMPYPDPRYSAATMRMVAGLSDRPLIALGRAFGSSEELAEKIKLGEQTYKLLPGERGLVYAQQRVALARVFQTEDESDQSTEDDSEQARATARALQKAIVKKEETSSVAVRTGLVVPVETLIEMQEGVPTTSNSAEISPGATEVDSVIRTLQKDELLYLEVAADPGHIVQQLSAVEKYLQDPRVSIVLDTSEASELGEEISATEINEATQYLANFVRENHLPQKSFNIQQGSTSGIDFPEKINYSLLEVAISVVGESTQESGLKEAYSQLTTEYESDSFHAVPPQSYWGWSFLGFPRRGGNSGDQTDKSEEEFNKDISSLLSDFPSVPALIIAN